MDTGSLRKRLLSLCQENISCANVFQHIIANVEGGISSGEREAILDKLAGLFLLEDCTEDVIKHFYSLALEILDRAKASCMQGDKLDFRKYQLFCVSLSNSLHIHQDVLRASTLYLEESVPFFQIEDSDVRPKKRNRISLKAGSKKKQVAEAAHRFCQYPTICSFIRKSWNWGHLFSYLECDEYDTKWCCLQAICRLMGLGPCQTSTISEKFIDASLCNKYQLMYDVNIQSWQEEHDRQFKLMEKKNGEFSLGPEPTNSGNSNSNVAYVGGILLPKMQGKMQPKITETDKLVKVPSTERNLQRLALAVSSENPVLLEGPVGCGKTALVTQLAAEVGRNQSPYLTKIQLGDQTDSKVLLGTYRCTSIPGEFVWQAGPLTEAVTKGHWILLEDLDYAPMDVLSILMPLLQSRTLCIPGHGDEIQAAPSFRLFASLRTYGSTRGFGDGNIQSVLHMWTRISPELLSRTEVYQIVKQGHPQLDPIAEKLLDIYLLLCEGLQNGQECSTVPSNNARYKKYLSVRDLLKWCDRIAPSFNMTDPTSGNLVFQEAIDCFCASIPSVSLRIKLAEDIGAYLNISNEKARYFLDSYKPVCELTSDYLSVGRIKMARFINSRDESRTDNFALTRETLYLLEKLCVCVCRNEPTLLVGETGSGKTTAVQYLAQTTGKTLTVVNLSQQSESTDLFGGYKPVDFRSLLQPLRDSFELLLSRTFSKKRNQAFIAHIQECFLKQKWAKMLRIMKQVASSVAEKKSGDESHQEWIQIQGKVSDMEGTLKVAENALSFSFIEGSLTTAVMNGDWVLLDEINLASAETLESLSGLLEGKHGSLTLLEKGDSEPVKRHPDFRLFACMNPSTDIGKKELPPGIRNRFTEIFVDQLQSKDDLKVLVTHYLRHTSVSSAQINNVVEFYLTICKEAGTNLTDGTGSKPFYSLRTLCRALEHANKNKEVNVLKGLYEGFCLAFFSQIDRASRPIVENLIIKFLFSKRGMKRKEIESTIKSPLPRPAKNATKCEGYWIIRGTESPQVEREYILTPSVRGNLRDIARAVSSGGLPVLLQGETSVGKTSLVRYLANATGNVCVRINNHEHTDIQEYIGSYTADSRGKLFFKEGALVQAVRKGHWVILDELNLAPSDVLEALNRLLDDNHELFIPETKEVIHAHPLFRLFATQNPVGYYGGRKALSKAFRNRFIELHFENIPNNELEDILSQRCDIPRTYCKKMIVTMIDLQTRRRDSNIFAGKQGFITLRDLFRWAERYKHTKVPQSTFFDWDQFLVEQGYLLLAGRVRTSDEAELIRNVLEKHFKKTIDCNNLFSLENNTAAVPPALRTMKQSHAGHENIVWTMNARRMATLVGFALHFKEPVLLVGDTGCGKTTMCQLYSHILGRELMTLNCHMHTETADFIGGLRPCRHHSEGEDEDSHSNVKLFEWSDGPLVKSMKDGNICLLDEISLAEDSVLERINSVLEPERTLLLAEKSDGARSDSVDEIIAHDEFRVIATMNPGGDFGKKELSPALRNRFTEIWCPTSDAYDDLVAIIENNIKAGLTLWNKPETTASGFGEAMINFTAWFYDEVKSSRFCVSIRDLMTWVSFINHSCSNTTQSNLSPAEAYLHGGAMVFLDRLSLGQLGCNDLASSSDLKMRAGNFLMDQVRKMTEGDVAVKCVGLDLEKLNVHGTIQYNENEHTIAADSFSLPQGNHVSPKQTFSLNAPTTYDNAVRLMRAMQLSRPILLEGSPGVGKTSLVSALANVCRYKLTRINLSEQTDVTDLFGSDLPEEGGSAGSFAWRDGPLLQALKEGNWIVFDEMNLASQSVLEGLNACLDHRGEIFVPELSMTFKIDKSQTKIFACQNPVEEGGSRKSLPRSFLNRFTQVFIEPMKIEDQMFILSSSYPEIPGDVIDQIVSFNNLVNRESGPTGTLALHGGPWEFNLRDTLRWCEIMHNQPERPHDPSAFLDLIYCQRLRLSEDRTKLATCWEESVLTTAKKLDDSDCVITDRTVQIGSCVLERKQDPMLYDRINSSQLVILQENQQPLQSLMYCVQMNWMSMLIGKSGCGKSSVVHNLAFLTRNNLEVIPMNSSMDTTDLLGGFEQFDICRDIDDVLQNVRELAMRTTSALLCSPLPVAEITNKTQTIVQEYSVFTELRDELEQNNFVRQQKLVSTLLALVAKMKFFMQDVLTDYNLADNFVEAHRKLSELQTVIDSFSDGKVKGGFQWIDSPLVKAMKRGHWALLENVNFCSPAVLDRLNAVLEPNGELSINERGVLDGQIPSIKPHANFRLFMTMDPLFGEISRAMRNRGIELYLLPQVGGDAANFSDQRSLQQTVGVFGEKLQLCIDFIHQTLSRYQKTGFYDLTKAARMFNQYLCCGETIETIIPRVVHEIYGHSDPDKHLLDELVGMCTDIMNRDISPPMMPIKFGLSSLMWDSNTSFSNTVRDLTLTFHLANKSQTGQADSNTLDALQLFDDIPMEILHSYWKILFENILLDNLPMASHLLLSPLSDLSKQFRISSDSKNRNACLDETMTILAKTMQVIADHPVKQKLVEICTMENEKCVSHQSDRALIPSIACLKTFDELGNFCNQFEAAVEFSHVDEQWKHTHDLRVRHEADKWSILAISELYNKGQLTSHQLPDQVYADVYPYISLICAEIREILAVPGLNFTKDTLNDWQVALRRLKKILVLCTQPMDAADHEKNFPALQLQWQWLNESTQHIMSLSDVIRELAHKIQLTMGVCLELKQFWDKIVTSNTHAPLVESESVANIMSHLCAFNYTTFGDCNDLDTLFHNTAFMILKGEDMKKSVLQMYQGVSDVVDMDSLSENLKNININENGRTETTCQAILEPRVPYSAAQVWPLLEYIQLVSQMKTYVDIGSHGSVKKETSSLLRSFFTKYCPGNPTDVFPFLHIIEDPTKIGQLYHACVCGITALLRTSTSYMNTLYWTSFSEQSAEPPNVSNGAGFPVLFFIGLESVNASSRHKGPANALSNSGAVTLKSYKSKMQQLREISALMWINMEHLSKDSLQPRILLRQSLLVTYTQVARLMSLCCGGEDLQGHISYLTTIESFVPNLKEVWERVSRNVDVIQVDQWSKAIDFKVNETWVLLGYVQCWLYFLHTNIDPIWQKIYLTTVNMAELHDVKAEIAARRLHHSFYRGRGESCIIPVELRQREIEVEKALEESAIDQSNRSDPRQFSALRKEIKQFYGNFLKFEQLRLLLGEISSEFGKADLKQTRNLEIEAKVKIFSKSSDKFCQRLNDNYSLYVDLSGPIQAGIRMIQHGMSQSLMSKSSAIDLNSPRNCAGHMLLKFPSDLNESKSWLSRATDLIQILNYFLPQLGSWTVSEEKALTRILDICVKYVYLHIHILNEMNEEIFLILREVFLIGFKLWKHCEDVRDGRSENPSANIQQHGVDQVTEEIILKELTETFPSYSEDFSTIEDCSRTEEHDACDLYSSPHLIADAHVNLFMSFTSLPWYQGTPTSSFSADDIVQVVRLSHECTYYLSKRNMINYDTDLNRYSIESSLIANQWLQDYLYTGPSKNSLGSDFHHEKPYDFYHDPNIKCVIECYPILKQISVKIDRISDEWPDHPTVSQMKKILTRLVDISIDHPLMKFLTGLEMVLENLQEWEANSSREYSVSDEIGAITNLILNWRKEELRCWESGLDNIAWEVQQSASRWWFFIYNTLQDFLFGKEENHEEAFANDLVQTLHQFLEQAPIGEFKYRLHLLLSFHCYVAKLAPSKNQDLGKNVLWNTYLHYSAFSEAICNAIKTQRDPIEKKVNDYVKIVQWNAHTLFAMKKNVNKTHRTLLTCFKQFKGVLATTSNQFLLESDKNVTDEATNLSEFAGTEFSPPQLEQLDAVLDEKFSLLQRLPNLVSKAANHCKSIITESDLPVKINTLEAFTVNVIEAANDLGSREVPQEVSEAKRKSWIKQSHTQKRKSVTDLFKNLKLFGLSFRKGLLLKSSGANSVVKSFWIKPIDIGKSMDFLPISDSDAQMKRSWNRCSFYFTRSISRLSLLHVALQKPHKQLNTYQMDRISGYAEHLTVLLLQQKSMLSAQFADYLGFRTSFKDLYQVCDKNGVPGEMWTELWTRTIKSICSMLQGLHELEVLLTCGPQQDVHESTCTPLQSKDGETLSHFYRNHPIMEQAIASVRACKGSLGQLHKQLQEISNAKSISISFVENALQFAATLETVRQEFQAAEHLVSSENNLEEPIPVFTTISSIVSGMEAATSYISEWTDKVCALPKDDGGHESDSLMFTQMQGLTHSVLLAIQNCKQQVSQSPTDEDVAENIFPCLTGAGFKRSFDALDLSNISLSCRKVIDAVVLRFKQTSCQQYSRLLDACLNFLSIYNNLAQTLVSNLTSAHRSSAKSAAVLLKIFTDLAQKGFCLPEDYTEEEGEEADGSDKFESGEAGLGDGEGQKDVSDQIETEDQLEDLKQDENNGDATEEKDVPEENENAIEMSENFEGKSAEGEEGEDEEDNKSGDENEDDIEDEIGEAGGEFSDTLDKKLWDEEKEDDDQKDNSEKYDDPGLGKPEEKDNELTAKDEFDTDAMDQNMEQQTEDQNDQNDQNEELDSDKLNEVDYGDLSDPENDPDIESRHQEKETEDSEIPDDLDLDDVTNEEETTEPELKDEEETMDIDDIESETTHPEPETGNDEDLKDDTDQDMPSADHPVQEQLTDSTTEQCFEGSEHVNSGDGLNKDGVAEIGQTGDGKDPANDSTGISNLEKDESAPTNNEENTRSKHSSEERLTGSKENPIERKGKIEESSSKDTTAEPSKTDTFEHTTDKENSIQKLDIATENQLTEESIAHEQMDTSDNDINQEPTVEQDVDIQDDTKYNKNKQTSANSNKENNSDDSAELISTTSVPRNPTFSFHGLGTRDYGGKFAVNTPNDDDASERGKKELINISLDSMKAWDYYENSTLSLAQELSEQLRLVLHPTGGKKMKGDFRTGKRLNMRRIIPYIASQFRKDKIWLRRTKPHKREYQIMVAMDNSSSMADNNLKRLAFQSIAVVANALNLVQAGQLGICSFGETMEVVHSFRETFSSNTGAKILETFGFDQDKTLVAQMMRETLKLFRNQTFSVGSQSPPISKLLLVLSDGRGIFLEGMNTVLSSVRAALAEGVFIVFIILDNPENKDSVLDIKVPVFKSGCQVPEIVPYMESFPFPHYIVLRNVDSLPSVFSDAIRQWFEMVVKADQ